MVHRSQANVRILTDAKYSRWEVEVASSSSYSTYVSRLHKLAPFFGLIFRRSSIQTPLLAGALGTPQPRRSLDLCRQTAAPTF